MEQYVLHDGPKMPMYRETTFDPGGMFKTIVQELLIFLNPKDIGKVLVKNEALLENGNRLEKAPNGLV